MERLRAGILDWWAESFIGLLSLEVANDVDVGGPGMVAAAAAAEDIVKCPVDAEEVESS